MTISSSSDDSASALLDAPAVVPSALEQFWRLQMAKTPRGRLARVLGRTPLAAEARPWFEHAHAEIDLGERLRALTTAGTSFRVLNAVPVEEGLPEVEHVVIGAAGVFTVALGDGGDAAVLEARFAARATAARLGSVLGRAIEVRPILVESKGTGSDSGDGVTHVDASRIARHLQQLPPVFSVEEVREITRAALRPRTWRASVTAPVTPETCPRPHELHAWFGRVRAEVQRAKQVQLSWAGALLAVFAFTLVEGPAIADLLLP